MLSKKEKSVLILIIINLFLVISCKKEPKNNVISSLEERQKAGGNTTVFLTSSNAYSTPAPNLSGSELDIHMLGDAQFGSSFVSAPAPLNAGLGTIYNNTSCISCHPRDGRAAFPTEINQLSGFFLRVSIPGEDIHGAPLPVTGFGTQIQNQALFGYTPEAKFNVIFNDIEEIFEDGTKVILKQPNYSLINTYIPFPTNLLMSPRIGSPIFGLGLLEAIDEAEILKYQDINDNNGDGISGKANYVFDKISGQMKLGRFGWKANTASVLEQCASAFNHDMGITNPVFMQETGYGQSNGDDGLINEPEISQEILNQVAFYCKTLGVPAMRNINKTEVINGSLIFENIGCAKCHIPKLQTGQNELSILSNQAIFPYTDMLLHDMGDALADNRPDYLANGNEWKTRPLWGIGLTQVVNGYTHFLHDGRAKNITEAILWHGGEANNSKQYFKRLSSKDRSDLLEFIHSL